MERRGEERKKLTDFDEFKTYGKDTYIYEKYGIISFSDGYYFKAHHINKTFIEYKAKGENMAEEMKQKEMKQKEMKHNIFYWAIDVSVAVESFARDMSESEADLQEAKSSAKKLIEKIDEYLESQKPKFKKGNIVASQVFDDGSFSLVRLNKDLTNRLTPVDGLWYTKRDCDITDMSLGVFKEDTRHATPEEIAEYEVALTFHKHGRKPFEVKEGDILKDDKGNILINDENILRDGFPKNLKKNYFTSGRYTFLKTVEEVNEWLKNK